MFHVKNIALNCLFLMLPQLAVAVDIVNISEGEIVDDPRQLIKVYVLSAAMEATIEDFGPYEITMKRVPMNRKRYATELNNDKEGAINVAFEFARKNHGLKVIAIPYPIRKGLVSYRLLMIKRGNEGLFKNITTAEQLAKLRTGANPSWATYQILEHYKFNIVNVERYESLFTMLSAGRFDYLIRTANEAWPEQRRYAGAPLDLVIEPSVALYIPSATYMYVSKNSPALAFRLTEGMKRVLASGLYEKVFQAHYAEILAASNFENRRVIKIDNPYLPDDVPVGDPKLWFTPKFKNKL